MGRPLSAGSTLGFMSAVGTGVANAGKSHCTEKREKAKERARKARSRGKSRRSRRAMILRFNAAVAGVLCFGCMVKNNPGGSGKLRVRGGVFPPVKVAHQLQSERRSPQKVAATRGHSISRASTQRRLVRDGELGIFLWRLVVCSVDGKQNHTVIARR